MQFLTELQLQMQEGYYQDAGWFDKLRPGFCDLLSDAIKAITVIFELLDMGILDPLFDF